MGSLEELAPVALLRVRESRVVEVNALACELLGAPSEALTGTGFAGGLLPGDAAILSELANQAGLGPSEPTTLRWGSVPPAVLLQARSMRADDGDVLIALVDVTDERRLDSSIGARGSALLVTDTAGTIRWISPASCTVLAATPDAFVGLELEALTHPADHELLAQTLVELEEHPGVELSRTFRLQHPLVADTWWSLRVTSVYLPDDPAVGGVLTRLDIILDSGSELDADESSSPKLQSIAELTPAGIIATAGGRITLRNALARQLVGPILDEVDALRWVEAVREDDRDELLRVLVAAGDKGERGRARVALDRPDGSTIWLRVEVIPTRSTSGLSVGYVATLLDVTVETTTREELRAAQERLWELANHDALTGLPNRMRFGDRLIQALARLRREDHGLALLYGDLDEFKPVNDTYGHDMGDRVLVEVGHRIREVTRETDTVCRYGGDEFVVLCERFETRLEVETVAHRIVEAMQRPFEIDDVKLDLAISVGVAVAEPGSTADSLVTAADDAMYAAKRSGKGRVAVAPA